MEILKPGRDVTEETECPKCGCVFRYSLHSDVYFARIDEPGDVAVGNVEFKAFVKCPCCRRVLPATMDIGPLCEYLS